MRDMSIRIVRGNLTCRRRSKRIGNAPHAASSADSAFDSNPRRTEGDHRGRRGTTAHGIEYRRGPPRTSTDTCPADGIQKVRGSNPLGSTNRDSSRTPRKGSRKVARITLRLSILTSATSSCRTALRRATGPSSMAAVSAPGPGCPHRPPRRRGARPRPCRASGRRGPSPAARRTASSLGSKSSAARTR